MQRIIFLFILVSFMDSSMAQKKHITYSNDPSTRFEVDKLIATLRKNRHLDSIISEADNFYNIIGLKEENVSRKAFIFAFLSKKLVDEKELKGDSKDLKLSLIKRHTLLVVDFTKKADMKRLAVVDLKAKKLLYNTLTSHGKGKVDFFIKGSNTVFLNFDNPINTVPKYFGNKLGSNRSSLGFMVTTGNSPPNNPCHKCKYSLDFPHVCQLTLKGLEIGINDSIDKNREIVIHTTGSRDFSDPSSRTVLRIKDERYKVDTSECACYNGGKKFSSTYATAKYLEHNKYMGRSLGCLVLPEEEHIEIMKAVQDGCLVFCYSDVINETANYFANSPVVKQIIAIAGKKKTNRILN